MKYKYQFANSESIEIHVDNFWIDLLTSSDTEIASKDKKERRHCCSLNQMSFEGQAFARIDKTRDIIESEQQFEQKRQYKNKEVQNTYRSLTVDQKDLIEKVVIEKMKVKDYAQMCGVDQSAISHRLMRIRKKFKKFL